MNKKSLQKDRPGYSYYIFSLVLFFCSIAIGFFFSRSNPDLFQGIKQSFQSLKSIDLPPFFLFLFIFLNNTIKAFFVMLFGFLFGIAPLYFTVLNGFIIGVASFALIESKGYLTLIAGLLPHGIFELSALIIVMSYSFWLSVLFFNSMRHKNEFIYYLIQSIKFFAKVIVPILAVAALIEVYVTPYLINLTLK